MPAYMFTNPAPVFFDLLGDDKVAGGSLTFYERGTATPKDTWNSPEQTVLNANPITLDGSGRSPVPIFLDGEYTVALRDSVGAVVWTRDVTPEAAAGTGIPTLAPGFLTNDLSNLLWRDLEGEGALIPDPTGQDGKVLTAAGGGSVWAALAAVTANATITFVPGGFKLSDGSTARMVQFGSDTISPPSGSTTSIKSFTFATPFSATPTVIAIPNGRANPGGGIPAHMIENPGPNGAGFVIDTNGYNNIVSNVPFSYIAIGPVAP